jgi:hypothetical protein
VKDATELELVPVGFAIEPVARPLQVLEVQVPNVDQPVGVENVEDEVDAPLTGVELEPVLHAPPQAQLEDEDGQVRLALELEVVLEVEVDVETGLIGIDVGEL